MITRTWLERQREGGTAGTAKSRNQNKCNFVV